MATDRRDDKAPALVQHELGSLKTSSGPITDGVVLEGNEIMLAETKHHIQDSESESKSHIKPFQQSKTSPEAPPFTTFLLFPRLPIELRLRIWSLVLPQSALVRIEACWSNDPQQEVFFSLIRSPGNHNIRRTRKNGLLRVCKESRESYCKQFPYALPFASPFNSFDGAQTQRIRLGDIDTIHIENIPALRSINLWWDVCVKQEWVRIVKGLRITVCQMYRMDWVAFFDIFANLEKLEVVSRRRIDADRLLWLEKEKERILEAKRDSVLLGVEGIDYNGDTAKPNTL